MAKISNNILTVTEPTIRLETFEIGNSETADKPNTNNDKMSKFAGDQFPAIRINGVDFNRDDIVSFNLNLDSVVPSFNVVVKDTKGQLTKSRYPADGDVINILIRSKDEDTTKTRKLDGTVPLIELPNLMRAMGYYPTE